MGGPRGDREEISRGVANECVKERARARAGVNAEGHHHRCYLNVFVGREGVEGVEEGPGGGVIGSSMCRQRGEPYRESVNQFVCRLALWFYSREEILGVQERERGAEEETVRGGSERASARGIEMLLMPGRAIGDKQK